MKILHLSFDGNFIENAITIFDYYYPGCNIWVIAEFKKRKSRIINKKGDNIIWIKTWVDRSYIQSVSEINANGGIDIIVCHGLGTYYLDVVKMLKEHGKPIVYWVFWGFELYWPLGYSGKKKLIDNDKFWNPMSYFQPTKASKFFWIDILRRGNPEDRLIEFLNYADFFCFWLYEDYLLLKKFYHCNIKFKYFHYSVVRKGEEMQSSYSERYFNKKPHTILINHQASPSGNHLTIMRKLKPMKGIEKYDLTFPLSYGSNSIKYFVCWKGKRLFGKRFHPVVDYMPLDNYNRMIGEIEIAIFGQLRQEAAGNIFFLLDNGAKIFMREDNSLYQHLKKQGYYVFSFEKELKTVDDLTGLSLEEKRHNAKLRAANQKTYQDFMPSLFSENSIQM